MKQEKDEYDDRVNKFYDASKKWWNSYKASHEGFDKRIIKIYGENEFGMFIPVCCFLKPLENMQGIDTPLHAARFVSLIPYRRFSVKLGERKEIWNKFHTLLVARAGDIEDHCLLLCSLFLGFGLDAYIVIIIKRLLI